MTAVQTLQITNTRNVKTEGFEGQPITIISIEANDGLLGSEEDIQLDESNLKLLQKSTLQELKEIQNHGNKSLLKSNNPTVKKNPGVKELLTLNSSFIKTLKSKERHAAETLFDIGINQIFSIKDEEIVGQFICPFENCGEILKGFYSLKCHYFQSHNTRPYKCDFNNCKWSFATKSKLERHKNSHLNLKWFKCLNESCEKMFTTLYNLRQHLKSVHEKPEQFACTVPSCGSAFHNQRSLDIHKATHSNLEPTYSCEHVGCEKTFVTRNALCSHMRSHEHKVGDLKCTWEGCNKIFEKPCRLREHMRTHTGEKPYRCDHPGCDWSFYSGSKLHRHQNKHLQIRKYVCCINQCNKSFLRSQHLREHILTHSKNSIKNFICPIPECDSRFGSRNLVYKHIKKVHRQEENTEVNDTKVLCNEFNIQIVDSDSMHPTSLNNQCINQLDAVTLLTGEYDACSTANAALSSQLPELISSELLVAMTSIDSAINASLVDISSIESPSNSESLVDMTSSDPHSTEISRLNDSKIKLVIDSNLNNRSSRKTKANGSTGSARTNYTFDDVMREKAYRTELETSRRIKWNSNGEVDESKSNRRNKSVMVSKQTEDLSNCKLTIPPDLVLGAPAMTDSHGLIVKDELYTQEDLQVLLLDSSESRNSIFEPSTINLRDLE